MAMFEAHRSLEPRGFTKVDATRAFVSIAILAVLGAGYWFALPAIQSLIIPSVQGGRNGPWILRPITAYRFGAAVVMLAVTFPLITWRLNRRWVREDFASGSRYDPFQGKPFKRMGGMIAGFLLLPIYAAALLFYLFSWTVIGPDGIEQHLLWTTLNHSYQDISALETIPNGERSDAIMQDGPWYSVKLIGGRSITLSLDNEGASFEELTAITAFIAERSGLVWMRRGDARPRS